MKRFRFLAIAGLSVILAAAAATAQEVKIPIEQYTLKNGLRVVLSEDHAAPTVSLCITYDVGSRNELPGHTRFAHLFEHMMFQGSENVGKGEHLLLVHVNGGDVNGTTNEPIKPITTSASRPINSTWPCSWGIRPHARPARHASESRQPAQRRAGRTAPAHG